MVYSVSTDHLTGSNVVTNSSRTIEELMDYYPYGDIRLDEKASTFSEQRKFAGHEYDVDTGLSYMNSRYYDAGMGRFVSQDPVFLAMGDNSQIKAITKQELQQLLSDPQLLSSYAYGRNNPLVFRDPDGNFIQIAAAMAFMAFATYAPQITSFLQSLTTPIAQYGLTQAVQDAKQGNYGMAAIGAVTSGEIPEGKIASLLDKGGDVGKAITKMNPSEIRFTQDSISSVFRNGNTLESTINGLKSGKISPNDFPPIRIFEKNGNINSLDNRRLEVFQKAGIDIPTIRATPQEIKTESWKFHPINDGKTIKIRGNN